jgi:hypothetical protein
MLVSTPVQYAGYLQGRGAMVLLPLINMQPAGHWSSRLHVRPAK